MCLLSIRPGVTDQVSAGQQPLFTLRATISTHNSSRISVAKRKAKRVMETSVMETWRQVQAKSMAAREPAKADAPFKRICGTQTAHRRLQRRVQIVQELTRTMLSIRKCLASLNKTVHILIHRSTNSVHLTLLIDAPDYGWLNN